jgi:hypothetical protein
MAFDAGAIEATLTLNRSPFTAGLLAAKRQAEDFARKRYTAAIDLKVDQRKLMEVEAQLKRLSRQRVQATAKVLVDRLKFDKLLVDLKKFDGKTYSANIDVDTAKATADVIAFRTLLASLNNQTVNLNANTRAFGRDAGNAFDGGGSRFSKMATAVIATLPIIASAFTATVGAVGALVSAFVIAGLGAAAFAVVAVPAFKKVKEAVASGQAEIDKLPPGLREAGNALQGFNKELDSLAIATQKVTGLALEAWFKAGTAGLKTLQPLIVAGGEAFRVVGIAAQAFLEGPWWKKFVDFLTRAFGPALFDLWNGVEALIEIVGNLTMAFWDLGGSQIMGMIVQGLQDFATWTETIGQNKTFQDFMEAAKRSLPVVGHLLDDLLVFIFKLAIALEPLGTLIIRVLNGIFDAVNSIPPSVLGALAIGFAAIWAAMALGATGPVGIAVGVLAGLAVIFTNLYEKNETFRNSINGLVDDLKAKWKPIWDTIVTNFNDKIKPAWDELVRITRDELIPKLREFGAVIEKEVWPKIRPLVDTITGTLIPAFLDFLGTLFRIVGFLVEVFGPTVAKELGDAFTVFDGFFRGVAGLLNIFTGVFTGDWTKFNTGIVQLTEGFWTIIAGMFGTNLAGLREQVQAWDRDINTAWTTFWNGIVSFLRSIWDTIGLVFRAALDIMHGDVSSAADKIGQVWRKIANLFAAPINWVINTVIGPPGGIAGAWNSVMSWIGAPGLNVQRPQNIPGFATGGVLPGYAPRRDSLLAAVSPGEAVMVPEWTRAVGGESAVRRMNADAISGKMYYEGNPQGRATLSLGGVIPHFAYGGVAPIVASAGDEITRVFGRMPGGIGGVGARANASDHPRGYALDFMVLANRALGDKVSSYLMANAGRMAVKYLIWLQRINSGSGWRAMADRGSPTANHMDHVHASFNGSGGGGPFAGGGDIGAAPPPVSWWSIVADKVTGLFKGLFSGDIPGAGGVIGDAMNNIPRLLVEKVTGVIKTKLEGMMTAAGSAIGVTAQGLNQNPLSGMGTSDRGAIIPPGASTLFNATGRPEPLTNLDVYERMKPAGLTVEDVLALIKAGSGDGSTGGGDTYNVMLPARATVRELADTIDFKRKVVAKGRYAR